jgi:RimJ/RimL family protein N-acetyltransferase
MAKASTIKFLVRRGSPRDILVIVRRFWQSETHYLGLRRDLCVPFTAPSAKVPIKVRELKPSDVKILLDTSNPTFSTDECILRHWQRKIVEAEIKTCFVAVTADDTPCYMQWLIGIEDLPRAKAFYGDQFPQIGPDEAILEGAFTPAEFRGQGIMPAAMALISEEAARRGARSIITFVANDNVPALKGCQRAGYEPYLERTRCWSRFRRKFSAVELPKGTPYPYEQENRATTA